MNGRVRFLIDQTDAQSLAAECEQLRAEVCRLNEAVQTERVRATRIQNDLRHKLARDLHDGPAQALATLAMSLDYLKKLQRQAPERVPEELDVLKRLVSSTTHELRYLLFELRPLILETQGLGAALELYVERNNRKIGPRICLKTSGLDERFSKELEQTSFSIVQEAVNNARKHAQARTISIEARVVGAWLEITVQDDGRGFDVSAVQAEYDRRESFGLAHLRERAALVYGELGIHSAPQQGTTVWFRAPLSPN